jgi:hypothetical protein
MLDSEDKEAVARIMTLFSTKMKRVSITVVLILVPTIVTFILLGIFVADIFTILMIPAMFLVMLIPVFIMLLPLRKELPRLKQMAQKYNFTPPLKADSLPSGLSQDGEPDRLPESPPIQPLSNLEAMKQQYNQKKYPSTFGIESGPTKATSFFSPKFMCLCSVFLLFVAGMVFVFIFMQNS